MVEGYKDTFPWMRAQHGLKGVKFQTDNGEFNSKACKDLVARHEGKLITNCPNSPETMSIIECYIERRRLHRSTRGIPSCS